MANFTISFRIAEKPVGGRSYEQRYQALIDAITGLISGLHWDRTTSYIAIQSDYTIDQIIAVCKAAISVAADIVLILDADAKSGRIAGANDDDDIFKIITYLKKV
jgi:hypothetical protein